MLRCVTITTDASFCPMTKAAGYAFRIKCDLFEVNSSGVFKSEVGNSTEAETYCIINALYVLHKIMTTRNLTTKFIVVNTDSKSSISILSTVPRKRRPHHDKKIVKFIKPIRDAKSVCRKLDFRHVKAHTSDSKSRSKANDWCDKAARNEMRLERIRRQGK